MARDDALGQSSRINARFKPFEPRVSHYAPSFLASLTLFTTLAHYIYIYHILLSPRVQPRIHITCRDFLGRAAACETRYNSNDFQFPTIETLAVKFLPLAIPRKKKGEKKRSTEANRADGVDVCMRRHNIHS